MYTVAHAADGHPSNVQRELVGITNSLEQRLALVESTLERLNEDIRDAR